jgi:apolipoprotein D and lipocalin family protein
MKSRALSFYLALAFALALNTAALGQSSAPVQAIRGLDLQRYQGTWYQVAFIPNKFQAMCVSDTSAHYTLEDGRITVLNRCKGTNAALTEAQGQARLARGAKESGEAKLQVRFAPAWLSWLDSVWGNYWVMALDANYQWALVGEPSRQFLWLLSRTPQLDAATQERILATAVAQGYSRSAVVASPVTAQQAADK